MNKKFNAVEFQRQVREKLSEQYNSNPEKFLRELKETYRDGKKKSRAVGKRRRTA